MMKDGRLLLIGCLEALSGHPERHLDCHELFQRVKRQPAIISHFWHGHNSLIGDVLDALPMDLYEHEATLALLTALEGDMLECLTCLQAYHNQQVWLPFLSNTCNVFSLPSPRRPDAVCMAMQRDWEEQGKKALLSLLQTRDEQRLCAYLQTATALEGEETR